MEYHARFLFCFDLKFCIQSLSPPSYPFLIWANIYSYAYLGITTVGVYKVPDGVPVSGNSARVWKLNSPYMATLSTNVPWLKGEWNESIMPHMIYRWLLKVMICVFLVHDRHILPQPGLRDSATSCICCEVMHCPCTHLLKEHLGHLRVSSPTWRFCKTAVSSPCMQTARIRWPIWLSYMWSHHTNRIEVGHRASLVGVY